MHFLVISNVVRQNLVLSVLSYEFIFQDKYCGYRRSHAHFIDKFSLFSKINTVDTNFSWSSTEDLTFINL
jgi:hypothetical protein